MIKFGTDGWRAIVADTFTFDNLKTVTQAIADYVNSQKREAGSKKPPVSRLPSPSLVVGYDNRFMAEDFAWAVCSVLAANRIKVVRSERPTPTPVVAFAVKARAVDGAIMLTASHNPFYYNGVKFIPEYAGPATADITGWIEKRIGQVAAGRTVKDLSGSQAKTSALVVSADLDGDYVAHVEKVVDRSLLREAGLKVVVDPLFGAAGRLMVELLEGVGVKCEPIHASRDVLFGGHLPDPSPENLKELRRRVMATGADIGIGLDGDGDRIGVIADDGSFVSANLAVSLLLIHLVERHRMKGAVVRSVATTHLLDAIADSYGVPLIETPVGFKYIGQEMLKGNVIIGGEESGGSSIGHHIPEKDALLASLLLCEMVAARGSKLSQIVKVVEKRYGKFRDLRLDIPLSDAQKTRLLSVLKRDVHTVGKWRVTGRNTKDGVKFLLEDGRWLLIRPSGTEPLVRAYLETHSSADLTELKRAAMEFITESTK